MVFELYLNKAATNKFSLSLVSLEVEVYMKNFGCTEEEDIFCSAILRRINNHLID
jgi:hypothetical protein